MRMKHLRPSTPAPKCNGYTDSLLSVEVLPFAPQHLPSLPERKQSCTESKTPVSPHTENVEVFSVSTSDSQKTYRRRRLVRSMAAFSETEEIPRLPELSSSSVYDGNENYEETQLNKVRVTGSQFSSSATKTERLQRCYSYPMPPLLGRQRSASVVDASSLEHLPSLGNSTKSVSTFYGRENRRKEAIRKYVESTQRNFDVDASKAIMFDNWIKSQQQNCQAR